MTSGRRDRCLQKTMNSRRDETRSAARSHVVVRAFVQRSIRDRHYIHILYIIAVTADDARTTLSLRVQFAFRAALPVHRFRPMHLVFQAHVTAQIGSTTESGVAEDAGRLVAMHFEVLGQRSEVPVNVSADSARKTPRALHQRLTGCIANVLPIASHPPCNTLTQQHVTRRFLTIINGLQEEMVRLRGEEDCGNGTRG